MSNIGKCSISELLSQITDSIQSRYERTCPVISDRRFFKMGLSRVLSNVKSGREFLQEQMEVAGEKTARQTFFDALHSARRLNFIRDCSEQFARIAQWLGGESMPDQLVDFPELDDWNVYAVDGHCIEHASHSSRSEKGTFIPAGMIYKTNLRNSLTTILGHQPQTASGGRKHELRVFKALVSPKIRNWLFVVDRAYIDTMYWLKARHCQGIRIVTRLKDNMKPMAKIPLAFDRLDKVNTGVTGFYAVSFNNTVGHMLMVEYTDPETGQQYSYITTMENVRPGVIAWLYKLRWNIEKVFDVFKNQFHQDKAWAASPVALQIGACMTAAAYNFVRLVEWIMAAFAITETKLKKKRRKSLQNRERKAAQNRGAIHPLEFSVHRVFTLSAQFIRTVRNFFRRDIPLERLVSMFHKATRSYL